MSQILIFLNNSVQFPLYLTVLSNTKNCYISGTVRTIFMGFQRGVALKLRNKLKWKLSFHFFRVMTHFAWLHHNCVQQAYTYFFLYMTKTTIKMNIISGSSMPPPMAAMVIPLIPDLYEGSTHKQRSPAKPCKHLEKNQKEKKISGQKCEGWWSGLIFSSLCLLPARITRTFICQKRRTGRSFTVRPFKKTLYNPNASRVFFSFKFLWGKIGGN